MQDNGNNESSESGYDAFCLGEEEEGGMDDNIQEMKAPSTMLSVASGHSTKGGDVTETDETQYDLVNSKNTVLEWRSAGVISEGASVALSRKIRRASVHKRLSTSLDPAIASSAAAAAAAAAAMMKMGNESSASLSKSGGAADSTPGDAATMAVVTPISLSYVTSLYEDFIWATRELGCTLSGPHQAEDWALFLHESLTRESREYHGISHVFEICAGASPMQLLAAAFRDCISHYIDGEIHPRQKLLLQNVFEKDGSYVLSSSLMDDPRDVMVVTLFGFEVGDDISQHKGRHSSLDVFLSALLATRLMKDTVQMKHAAQLACCLEGTIPFRTADSDTDLSPLDRLYTRLEDCNKLYSLGLSESDMVVTIQQAADLHNRSMGNMVSEDLAEFLDHTWSLLPEHHAPLRQRSLYTLEEYYVAIQSMIRFVDALEPSTMYLSFRGLPRPNELRGFHIRLQNNLSRARIYLRARVFSVVFVSSLACLTGGDGPKAFFYGDLPSSNRITQRLGDGLLSSLSTESEHKDVDHDVYDILFGYKSSLNIGFDARHEPLAAFLYHTLGDDFMQQALAKCPYDRFNPSITQEVARSLLRFIPFSIVKAVALELGQITISRKGRIERILATLDDGSHGIFFI